MASDKVGFKWGDVVIVKKTAPLNYKPGKTGSICGIRVIETEQEVCQFEHEIGTELFLIEFVDGESLEIPKIFLILYEEC